MKSLFSFLTLILFLIGSGFMGFSQINACQQGVDPEPTIWSLNGGNWNSTATWVQNRVPGLNDVVQIGLPGDPRSPIVTLDVSATVSQTVVCKGTLSFPRGAGADLTFQTDFLGVETNGVLDMGTSALPITRNVTLILKGKTPAEYNCVDTHSYCPQDLGLQVQSGGTWNAYGKALGSSPNFVTFTKLTQTASPGANSITVNGDVQTAGWKQGDQIVVAQTQTDWIAYSGCPSMGNTLQDQNERRKIGTMTSVGANTLITLDPMDPALQFRHEVTSPPDADGLNRESHVINITRNLKITSIDPVNRPSHVLIAGGAQSPTLAFVEFFGLASKLRADGSQPNRYPLHTHPDAGNFTGLSFHNSNRGHLVLHRGNNNTVTYNTFHDVHPANLTDPRFFGASIWLAFPTDETAPATQGNLIKNNVILLPPRTCLFSPDDASSTVAFVFGLYITHPNQYSTDGTKGIISNVVSGGFYAYYLNFEGLSPTEKTSPPPITFDNNTAYVGNTGLVQDSQPNPYRPDGITVTMNNFKAWSYFNNIQSFDVGGTNFGMVVWNNFKLFDSISIDNKSATIKVDSSPSDNTLDTVTLRNSVLKGNPANVSATLGGTNALICVGGDKLIVDAAGGGSWKFRGDVTTNVIFMTKGETTTGIAAVAKFDFGPVATPTGAINVGPCIAGRPILKFSGTEQAGTKDTFCNYPTTSTCGGPNDCAPGQSIGGRIFRSTDGAAACPNFSPNGTIMDTTCAAE